MALPKRQHSKQRTAKKRTHKGKVSTVLEHLPAQGSQRGFAHRVCPITGYYKGVQVIAPKAKKAAASETEE